MLCDLCQVGVAAPVHHLSMPLTERFLDVRTESATKAATILGVKFINTTTMLKNIFTRHSEQWLKTNVDEVSSIIFSNFYAYTKEDPSIAGVFSRVSFVRTTGGRLVKPTEVFSPEDTEIQDILGRDADVFPCGEHAGPERLQILQLLGLKTVVEISGMHLFISIIIGV